MIHEIITTNPMHKIIAPRISKKLPVFIETSKMDKLFKMIGEGDDFKSLRRRMVMEILYATGIRVSELIELRHKDIDTNSKIIRVSGKRKKQRIIPIAPYLCSIIDNYAMFKLQQGWNPAPGEFLITTTHGAKAYPKLIYNLVNQSLNLVTTQSKKSPHVIRHTFATGMLNNGADLNSIKELLGHTNLAATQVYTHNTIDRIKNIYQQAHPKA
jgi:integrase/recombinase XerC